MNLTQDKYILIFLSFYQNCSSVSFNLMMPFRTRPAKEEAIFWWILFKQKLFIGKQTMERTGHQGNFYVEIAAST